MNERRGVLYIHKLYNRKGQITNSSNILEYLLQPSSIAQKINEIRQEQTRRVLLNINKTYTLKVQQIVTLNYSLRIQIYTPK